MDHNVEVDQRCPICMVDYGQANDNNQIEQPELTRCNHTYGNLCLERYKALGNNACPLCRADLVDGFIVPGAHWLALLFDIEFGAADIDGQADPVDDPIPGWTIFPPDVEPEADGIDGQAGLVDDFVPLPDWFMLPPDVEPEVVNMNPQADRADDFVPFFDRIRPIPDFEAEDDEIDRFAPQPPAPAPQFGRVLLMVLILALAKAWIIAQLLGRRGFAAIRPRPDIPQRRWRIEQEPPWQLNDNLEDLD